MLFNTLCSSVVVVVFCVYERVVLCCCCFSRSAQPKTSEDIARQIFDKGRRIEQEFAEYFTGNNYQILL